MTNDNIDNIDIDDNLDDQYNIEDYKTVEICYNKDNPDAVVTANLLYRIWSGMCDLDIFTIYLTGYDRTETVKSGANLVVCLDVAPPTKVEQQLLVVSTDIALIKSIEKGLTSIRDLDKYKKCSIVYTPYSISHFILNYTKQCLMQDIKGINYLPYLEPSHYPIDLESYDDDIATLIYIENPIKEILPKGFKLDPSITELYKLQVWSILDKKPTLPLVTSYVLSYLKDEDIKVLVRSAGKYYLVACKQMLLQNLNDIETQELTDEQLERLLSYL